MTPVRPEVPLRELARRVVPYRVGLHASFRGITAREGVLIEGPAGWGEFAPFPHYPAWADAHWLAAAVESAAVGWPGPVRPWVPVNAIVPTCSPDDTAAWVRTAVADRGCRTVKLKVAEGDLEADLARVRKVREALDDVLGPGTGRIRIDANGRWTLAQAVAALSVLADEALEYCEQPCASVTDLLELRRRSVPVRVAVDETIRRDGIATDLSAFADVAVVKVAPLGGWRAAMDLCSRLDVPVVVSGAMETSLGLGRDAAFATALAADPLACGFDTGSLLADDVVAQPLLPDHGRIAVGGPLVPDPARLAQAQARLRAHGDPTAWSNRFEDAWLLARASGLVSDEDAAALGDVR